MQYFITCALLYLAAFSDHGAKADIQCHTCVWYDPDGSGDILECRDTPETTYLATYESPVDWPEIAQRFPKETSGKFLEAMHNLIAAVKGANMTAGGAASLATGEDLHSMLCTTSALKVNFEGETYFAILRLPYPVKNPDDYTGKCLPTLPPRLEEIISDDYLSYLEVGEFCYCDTDGCNNKIISVPGYDGHLLE